MRELQEHRRYSSFFNVQNWSIHWKYALLHWLYAAPVRVSAIFVAVEFAVAAARAVTAPRAAVVDAVRELVVPERPLITAVRVRVAVSVRGVVIGNVPARVATVFWARVCVAARDKSAAVRAVVAPRDWVVDVARGAPVDDAASRTAAYAGAPAKKPRIAPKSRIFFISDKNVSKFCKSGASIFLHIYTTDFSLFWYFPLAKCMNLIYYWRCLVGIWRNW